MATDYSSVTIWSYLNSLDWKIQWRKQVLIRIFFCDFAKATCNSEVQSSSSVNFSLFLKSNHSSPIHIYRVLPNLIGGWRQALSNYWCKDPILDIFWCRNGLHRSKYLLTPRVLYYKRRKKALESKEGCSDELSGPPTLLWNATVCLCQKALKGSK